MRRPTDEEEEAQFKDIILKKPHRTLRTAVTSEPASPPLHRRAAQLNQFVFYSGFEPGLCFGSHD